MLVLRPRHHQLLVPVRHRDGLQSLWSDPQHMARHITMRGQTTNQPSSLHPFFASGYLLEESLTYSSLVPTGKDKKVNKCNNNNNNNKNSCLHTHIIQLIKKDPQILLQMVDLVVQLLHLEDSTVHAVSPTHQPKQLQTSLWSEGLSWECISPPSSPCSDASVPCTDWTSLSNCSKALSYSEVSM